MIKMTEEVGKRFYEKYKSYMCGELVNCRAGKKSVTLELKENYRYLDGECEDLYHYYKLSPLDIEIESPHDCIERWHNRFVTFMLEEFGEEYIQEVRNARLAEVNREVNELETLLEEIKGNEK